jgi:hypothetical protein
MGAGDTNNWLIEVRIREPNGPQHGTIWAALNALRNDLAPTILRHSNSFLMKSYLRDFYSPKARPFLFESFKNSFFSQSFLKRSRIKSDAIPVNPNDRLRPLHCGGHKRSLESSTGFDVRGRQEATREAPLRAATRLRATF